MLPPLGKSGRKPELSVKLATPSASRRQDAANEHQRNVTNLGFVAFRPRKVGHDARAFREASPFPEASG